MEIKKEYEPFMKEVFRNLPATLFIKDKERSLENGMKKFNLIRSLESVIIERIWKL